MEWVSKTDTVGLLYLLLPGFLAAQIFYSLTAHPKKEAFERVVQALIFTVIVKAVGVGVKKWWWAKWHPKHPFGAWTDEKELVTSVVLAIIVGMFVALAANTDCIHWLLRKMHFTKRTAYPSEWYSGFHRYERDIIVFLKDGRRLRAWAEEYPDQCDRGHFLLQNIRWLETDGSEFPQSEIEATVIAAVDVEMIQFMPKSLDDLKKCIEDVDKDREKLIELRKKKEAEEKNADKETSNKEPTDGKAEAAAAAAAAIETPAGE